MVSFPYNLQMFRLAKSIPRPGYCMKKLYAIQLKSFEKHSFLFAKMKRYSLLTPSELRMCVRSPFPHPRSTKDCLLVSFISSRSSSHKTYKIML